MWLVAIYQEDLADDNSKRWYVFKVDGGYIAEFEANPAMRLSARNGKPYKTAKGAMRRVEAVYDPSNGCYHRNACKGGWTFVLD